MALHIWCYLDLCSLIQKSGECVLRVLPVLLMSLVFLMSVYTYTMSYSMRGVLCTSLNELKFHKFLADRVLNYMQFV